MSADMLIKPDEIIAELRKRYPSERVVEGPRRPEVPRVTITNEHLYGAVIYVYGEGVKGQYLRHGYFTREGQRYWLIEYGWTTLYGRHRSGNILPLVVLGMPTRFVYEYKPNEFVDFILEEIPMGQLEVREDQLINIDRVSEGLDPVLIVDKYDILRSTDGRPIPGELIDRVREQQNIIELLQRSVIEYERIISDYKINVNILRTRVAKLQELLASCESKMVKLMSEVTEAQQELLRLREEISVRRTEVQTIEEARERLRDLIDSLLKVLGDVIRIAGSVETVRKEEKREEEKGGSRG